MFGVKSFRDLPVFGIWDVLLVHDPFASAFEGINAPMNEHAESGLSPPGNPFLSNLTEARQGKEERQGADQNSPETNLPLMFRGKTECGSVKIHLAIVSRSR